MEYRVMRIIDLFTSISGESTAHLSFRASLCLISAPSLTNLRVQRQKPRSGSRHPRLFSPILERRREIYLTPPPSLRTPQTLHLCHSPILFYLLTIR